MRRLLSEPPHSVHAAASPQPLVPARFELVKELGSGGFGTVYQAWDRDASRLVALKVAHESRSHALRRFKSEFLTLVDMSHDHVANLYELHQEAGAWFFTMEYIDGVPLDTYLVPRLESWLTATRPGRPGALGFECGPTLTGATVPDASAAAFDDEVRRGAASLGEAPRPATRPATAISDFDRVRSVFRQVVEALAWLHASGHIHRDIKPSNVLVTSEGLVKLVDFGLVTKLKADHELPDGLAGTPPFMAPELALGQRPTAASDWYAVGVMLYLVLSGSLPYMAEGSGELGPRSTTYAPSQLCAGLPADLDGLCAALLQADPAERPDANAILATLAAKQRNLPAPAVLAQRPFVGRQGEVRRLAAALRPEESQATGSHVTVVSGPSGVGKTRLVDHVLRGLFPGAGPLVLRSRCLERGSLRFKALDGAIDDLATLLAARMPRDVERLLPPDRSERAAMMALFPVLVDSVLQADPVPELGPEALDRAAIAGLSQVLERIARQRRIVIVIDDAQWVDGDSVQAAGELARLPVDWIIVQRPTEGMRARMLDGLLARLGPPAARTHVSLAVPAAPESRRIADLALLSSQGACA